MTEQTKGVLAVVGSSVAMFWYGAFIFGFPGVMARYWMDLFQVGRGAVGTTLFFVLASLGVLMFLVGRWQERLGIRRMVTIGAVICGLNVMFIAVASKLWMLYLWAFLMGAGSCFVYTPALTSLQRWFPTRRGLVSGIMNCAFGVAGAVMAPVFGYLHAAVGYATMSVALGLVALIVGLIAAQFTEAPAVSAPAGPPASGNPTGPTITYGHVLTVGESLRTAAFWFLWGTWALQGAAGISMVTLSTGFGLSKGLGLESAVGLLIAFNVSNGVSRLLTGFLSDVVGRNGTMSCVFLSAGVAYLVLPHVNEVIILLALCAVIGFALGSLFAVSAPLAVDCFGLQHFGAVFGLVFTAYGFVSGAIGPSLSGFLLDRTQGNYVIVFGYLGAFCLISSILIFFVRPTHVARTRARA